MTPHPHPSHPGRAVPRRSRISRHVTRARRAAFVGAVVAASGVPLVAHAIGEPAVSGGSTAPALSSGQVPAARAVPDLGMALVASVDVTAPAERLTPQPAVDPTIALLAATYAWDETGPRVVALQTVLGVTADGRYGHATRGAHLSALAWLGMSAGHVPASDIPPGTTESGWAALRECESNGNYSVVNPSGTYRGAYQFDRSTWNSVASRHAPELVGVDPAAASPADQDAMAYALYSERGASPWPHCGRHL